MGQITKKLESKYYLFLAHYYRAEVYRETAWRNRLDITTNWSIVISAAILSFVFGTPGISHSVIIINYLIVWFFLYIEARRFRYYSSIRDRVRLFNKNILGPIFSLDEIKEDSEDWIQELGENLIRPKVKMSRIESLSWRLRRNYVFILPLIYFVWIYKVSIIPESPKSISSFLQNAHVSFIPGIVIFLFMTLSLIAALVIVTYVSQRHKGNDLP